MYIAAFVSLHKDYYQLETLLSRRYKWRSGCAPNIRMVFLFASHFEWKDLEADTIPLHLLLDHPLLSLSRLYRIEFASYRVDAR